ncbi:MAG: alkaline phosphatase family protein [Halobacteriales archaeon]
MFREAVAEQLREDQQRDGYLFPAYDSYCIGNIPDTVRSVFDLPTSRPLPDDVVSDVRTDVNRVVMVVVDGFGLDVWEREQADHAFLQSITDAGVVTPLTSIYPSETAAAITTLETGQLACEHGRIGWNVYEPQSDRSFLALDGRIKVGPGTGDGPTDEAFAGLESFYEPLADAGIEAHRLQPFEARADSVAHHVYEELETFGRRLSSLVNDATAPAYFYGYLPHVDHAAHEVGTRADAYRETVAAVSEQLEAFVAGLDADIAADTLLLVVADHGHVNTDPDRNVDLSGYDTLLANLERHDDGTPVRLAGSPRNVHLHLQDGTLGETRAALEELEAQLWTREEALSMDLFGDRPNSDLFRRRCGDLVLTHRDLGTWWADVEAAELSLIGMHGGLHPDEMLVPFAAVRADQL